MISIIDWPLESNFSFAQVLGCSHLIPVRLMFSVAADACREFIDSIYVA